MMSGATTTAPDQTAPRTYRFPIRDRSGWLLGLQGGQCLALAAGAVLAGVALSARAPAPVVLGPFIVSAAIAFSRVAGEPLYGWIPIALRWLGVAVRRRNRWYAPVPLVLVDDKDEAQPLPDFLAGLEVIDAGPLAWATTRSTTGVVRDRRDRTVSATLRLRSRSFVLCDRAEQERLLAAWGDAIAGCCTEGSPITHLRWCEWAAPATAVDHLRYLEAHKTASVDQAAVVAYRELVEETGGHDTTHDTLLTVTLDPRRLRRATAGVDGGQAAVDALLDEMRSLTTRLEAAGLDVDPPLAPVELVEIMRLRMDPGVAAQQDTRRNLALLTRATPRYGAGPLAASTEWSCLRLDGSLHRTYWIAEWPRLEVPPTWLEPLLLINGGIRTVSVCYEPVPPSRSVRQVDRDATRLATDEEQRARGGFRIGARHNRAAAAVTEREAELVAGYAELAYAGFITVTARDTAELARSCTTFEQAAAAAGLELRALHGRHDLGFLTALPIGRGVAPRRFT
jgi:hypothetical protein